MRKLAIFAIAFAAATACYVWLLPPCYAPYAAGVLLLTATVLCFFHTDRCRRIRLLSFGAAFGLLWSWGYERVRIEPLRSYCGERNQIIAEVCEEAQATDYGCCVTARLGGGKIFLYLDCAPQDISLGDTVTVTAEVVDVSRGSDDEENLFYQSRDISLLGFQRGEAAIEKAEKLPISCYPAAAASALKDRINAIFPKDAAGFISALLTGDRSGLSYTQRNEMSIVGVSHVVAVSGMHISLIVGAVMLLCLRRRRIAAVVSIAVMIFFAAMVGFTPSVTRALIMNSILLLAPLLGRENDPPTALSFALLVILLFQPWAIANISLQLSFGAMVGIFYVTPRMYQRLSRPFKKFIPRWRLFGRAVRYACMLASTTFGATSLTLPLVAASFGTVSLISPLTNLLLLPWLSVIFCCGFAVTIAGLIFQPLGAALAWLLTWPVRFVLWKIKLFASIPYAAVYTNSGYIVAWLATAYLMVGICLLLRRGKYRLPALVISIAVTLIGAILFSAQEDGETAVTAFDVGQGQCVFLRSGAFTALVDCGGDSGDFNGETVARSLLTSGHREIDYLILTHYDTDHTCGTAQLLSRIHVGELLLPDIEDDTDNRNLILAAAEETGTAYRVVSSDTVLPFEGGTLSLFAPDDGSETNASLTALFTVEEYDVLITGDMSAAQERKLLQTHALPDVEVLLAGHHGSKTSTSEALLQAVTPEIVLISVGENRYGHPTQETLDRIVAVGAAVYRTDLDGDITVTRETLWQAGKTNN